MSSFKEKAYLQPYGLFLCSTQLQPVEVQVGQLEQIDVSHLRLERVWAINLSVDPPDARDYARFSGILDGDSISILSCWVSEERPVEQVTVTGEIWGIEKRTWEGLVTRPFWFYLLQESLFHIESEDYPVAILISAMAFEWFLYNFLEDELQRRTDWNTKEITKNVRGFDIWPSIQDKVKELAGKVLGFGYDVDTYNLWARDVRGPRNRIMHGHDDIYDQFKYRPAMLSTIASASFILDLINFVEADDYLAYLKKELGDLVARLKSNLD